MYELLERNEYVGSFIEELELKAEDVTDPHRRFGQTLTIISLVLQNIVNLKMLQVGVGAWEALTDPTRWAITRLISLQTLTQPCYTGQQHSVHIQPSSSCHHPGLKSTRIHSIQVSVGIEQYEPDGEDGSIDDRASALLDTLDIHLESIAWFCGWLASTYSVIDVSMLQTLCVSAHAAQFSILNDTILRDAGQTLESLELKVSESYVDYRTCLAI